MLAMNDNAICLANRVSVHRQQAGSYKVRVGRQMLARSTVAGNGSPRSTLAATTSINPLN